MTEQTSKNVTNHSCFSEYNPRPHSNGVILVATEISFPQDPICNQNIRVIASHYFYAVILPLKEITICRLSLGRSEFHSTEDLFCCCELRKKYQIRSRYILIL